MALRWNETEFHRMLSSPTGPVGRHLERVGRRSESVAKALITTEKLVRSGTYRSSISWRLANDGTTLTLRVGSSAPQARLIEFGTPAHVIAAKRRVVNVFGNIVVAGRNGFPVEGGLWWTHGADRGWFVPDHPLQSVNHPGTRAYMILHRAVASVLRQGGTA